MPFTLVMSEDALIRLDNLKRLKHDAAYLSANVGGRVSYWHDMLKGNKSFGEKAARNLEDKLSLVRGSLDVPVSATLREKKQNTGMDESEQMQRAPSNVSDIPSRRSTDTAEQALRVLGDIIRPMSHEEREVLSDILRRFGLNPDNLIALSSLLAGLDSANARRHYVAPPQSTSSQGR